jgi:hypothetical protein
MTTILTYGEIIAEIVGLFLILIAFVVSIQLIIKTAGKLKKSIVYFLIGSIIVGIYFGARLLNIEVLLPEGKLIDLILTSAVSFFVLMGIIELNKIVNEIINGKKEYKTDAKSKKQMKIENNQQEKRPIITFAGNLGNKYLDLTGRKPRYRQ